MQLFEPVHLGEDGVHDPLGHLRFAHAAASRRDEAVELVDEDDGRSHLPRAGEQTGDLLLALAIPLAQEVRRLGRDEVGLAFPRAGLGQQRLARARRAIEQEALRRTDAQPPKRIRVLQRKLDTLAQLLRCRVQPADILPADVGHLHQHLAHGRGLHPLQRIVEVRTGDRQLVEHLVGDRPVRQVQLGHDPPHRLQRRLAGEGGEVRTDEAVGPPRQLIEVHPAVERHTAGVDAKDLAPAVLVRHPDQDLPVEPAGTAQSFVDRFRPVGGGDHHQVLARLQTVHQRQQLGDEALLRLSRHLPALGGDRINLVDEDDRRRGLARFLEQFTELLLGLAIGRAHDLWTRDVEELCVALVGHCSRQPGLAGAGRAVEQHALGRIDAEALEQLGMAQRQLDHLAQRVDGAAHAAEIIVSDVGAPLAMLLGIFRQQLHLGVAVDVDNPARCSRHDSQSDLLNGEGRGVEDLPHMFGHVGVDPLVTAGRHRVAGGDRTSRERPLQRLGRPLEPDIVHRRCEHHARGGLRRGRTHFHEVTRTDAGVGPLQAVETDDVEPLVVLQRPNGPCGGRALADDLDDVPVLEPRLVHEPGRQARDAAAALGRRQVRHLQAPHLGIHVSHAVLSPSRPTQPERHGEGSMWDGAETKKEAAAC